MINFDNCLVDYLFQRFSNFMHGFFGISCYFLAKVCFMISACFFFWKVSGIIIQDPIIIISVIFWILLYKMHIATADHFEKIYAQKGAVISLRASQQAFRIVSIALCLLCIIKDLFFQENSFVRALRLLDDTFWLAGNYFLACVPLPPGKSRFKKAIDAVNKFFEIEPALEPVRIPTRKREVVCLRK